MKRLALAIVVGGALISSPAMAEGGAAGVEGADIIAASRADQSHFTTAETPLGDLLNDEAAREVLQQHIPDLVANPQIDMARSMTLKALQNYAPNLGDEVLAAIDADLAELPPH